MSGNLLQTEFTTLSTGVEATAGTAASTWRELQYEPDGLTGFNPAVKMEARDPVSSLRMNEKGIIVDKDVAFSVVHDVTKDLIDQVGEAMFRAALKQPGGTGTARWINATGFGKQVTAVTTGGYTVASDGALPDGTLVRARGFTNSTNNGLHPMSSATSTSLATSDTLVAESSPPTGAMVEVCGLQGTSGDITIDVTSGVITIESTTLDFTDFGLVAGMWLWIGGGTAATPGNYGFATAADRGLVKIKSIAAHAVVVDHAEGTWASDDGSSKTIRIFFGPWIRNVAGTDTDDKRTSHSFELAMPDIGDSSVDAYLYATGGGMNTVEINAPLGTRIKATMAFIGFDITKTTTRKTGASTALAPQNTQAFATADQIKRLRVTKRSDGSEVLAEGHIQGWKLTLGENISGYKAQGTIGNADLIYGKFSAQLALDASVFTDDYWDAVVNNDSLSWEVAVRNEDCAILFELPSCDPGAADPKLSANKAVTIAPTLMAQRDPDLGYVCAMQQFPYLPES